VVAVHDPERDVEVGVGHLELGLELLVLDRLRARLVDVVAEHQDELAVLLGADLGHRLADLGLELVALAGVADRDELHLLDGRRRVRRGRRVVAVVVPVAAAVVVRDVVVGDAGPTGAARRERERQETEAEEQGLPHGVGRYNEPPFA
jgi:hypothetical protein